jgi:hypothetical protein
MSEARLRKTRQQKFLDEHPNCYFCGGANPATTIDHVPPRACFPDGYSPEGFESPACKACNEGTVKQDQLFGLYSMLFDFDESKMGREEDLKKMMKLRQGIANNYPEALPDEARAYPVNRVGSIITPKPVAISLPTTPSLKNAVEVAGRKLTHALYFRETGKILTPGHQFLNAAYQPQRVGTQDLTALLTSFLPNLTVGGRTNIKEYGDRFRYNFGNKEQEDFFFYGAQFGHGIILWGIVCGPGTKRPSSGPLHSAPWLSGACGPGANAEATS